MLISLSPKFRFLGWRLAAEMAFVRDITSCGIGISVKLHLLMTPAVVRHKNLYPTCLLLLGPRPIPPLLCTNIVFVGELYSCVF